MGSAWSSFQSTKTCANTNCAAQSPDQCTGFSVAGIGTFVLFFLTVALTLLFSLINILRQAFDRHRVVRKNPKTSTSVDSEYRRSNAITEAVILNFSDQQLITGIAMAVTVRYMYQCNMTAYQYDMVCYLLLCSVTTHLASLLAIDKYFYPFEKPLKAMASKLVLLILRSFGIVVSIVLTGLILAARNPNTFPVDESAAMNGTNATNGTNNLLLYPAVCFFTGADAQEAFDNIPETFEGFVAKNWSHGLIQYLLFILCIIVTIPIAIIHSFERGISLRLAHPRWLIGLRLIVLACGIIIIIWTFVLALKLREFMHGSGKPANSTAGSNDNTWTFAQVLAVSILAFSPIEGLNTAADKYDTQKLLEDHGITWKDGFRAADTALLLTHGNDRINL